MAYHFSEMQLRVFQKYCRQSRNKAWLSDCRMIILEHILPTTQSMIELLMEAGTDIFAIFAKPYSIDKSVLAILKEKKLNVIEKSYHELETDDTILNIINSAIVASKKDNKKIILLDVGGYFAGPIQQINKDDLKYIYGIVEDTTFGHNRYLASKSNINVPIYSVARSNLKEIEAHFVGRDAVLAVDNILRNIGVLLSGRHSLVVGYGMIGKNVAIALRNSGMKVSVYDDRDQRNLTAYIDGFNIHKKKELIKTADIIFSATGNPSGALTMDEIEECKNNVILASVGSKDTEFAIAEIKDQAIQAKEIGPHLVEYTLSNDRHIIVAKDGTAVNFLLPSLSVEVLDLVFSEILLCVLQLLKHHTQDDIKLHEINNIKDENLSAISKDWLRIVNN